VLALPFALGLLANSLPGRRRWVYALLCLGAIVAIVTGLGRLQLIGAGLGVIVFAGLASVARQRVIRVIGALLAILILAVPTGVLLVSVLRKGTLNRYQSISLTSSSTTLHKQNSLSFVLPVLEADPFGLGLGTEGPVSNLGGKNASVLGLYEGNSGETQFNFIANELGAPGLLVWVGLALYMMALVAFAMRRVRDPDLAIYLAAAFAPFFALFIEGSSGPLSNSTAAGPYFWFAIGIAAYWLVGPGRRSHLMAPVRSLAAPAVVAKAT
jgi:MFS family permease